MKNLSTSLLAATVLLTLAGTASAQIFGPSTSATQDSDVINAGFGGTAFAFDFTDHNNSTTTVVNGVTFSGNLADTATGVDFSYSVGGGGADQNGVNGAALAMTGGSTNYASILQHLVYGGGTGFLTFTGLQVGAHYELQLFAGGGASNPEVLTDASTIPGPTPPSPSGTLDFGAAYNPAVAAFINERFTANSSTETIGLSSDSYLIISAVNLQNLSAVPEPSTYALMLGGLVFLGVCLRRKNGLVK